ncbi:MAG: phosphoenolpyruvate synthase, partial [Leeuwenhoekiella sp.]
MKTTLSPVLYNLLFLLIWSPFISSGQEYSNEQIEQIVEQFKDDARGPFLRIRWFCDDGTMREPKDPCPDKIGGIQHASYKDQTVKLQERNHLFFGEILAAAENKPFWDSANNHSRLKQYQLNKYLASVDNGWVLEKAQYYRGAIQSEDEEAWGIDFYKWLLADDSRLAENFYLIRQSLKDIPHAGDDNLAQRLRSESKVIADSFPQFMNIRVKIHGQPDATDKKLVADFREKYEDRLSPKLKKNFQQLSETLQQYYAPIDFSTLSNQIESLKTEAGIKSDLLQFASTFTSDDSPEEIIHAISDLLCDIRTQIYQVDGESDRLQLLDISLKLERVLLQKASDWKTNNLQELLDKIYQLSYATAGTGSLELWEWEEIAPVLAPIKYENVSVGELRKILNTARNVVQWSAAMAKVTYGDVVEKYAGFDPLSGAFIDDRIRSSVALPLGQAVADLAAFLAEETQMENSIMDMADAST